MLGKELNVTQNIQYQCLAIHMFTIDPLVGEKRLKTRHHDVSWPSLLDSTHKFNFAKSKYSVLLVIEYQIKWMCEILCTFSVCFYYYKDWCYVWIVLHLSDCDEKVPPPPHSPLDWEWNPHLLMTSIFTNAKCNIYCKEHMYFNRSNEGSHRIIYAADC